MTEPLLEALVVVGWFTAVKAVLDGAVSPSLTAVVEHVRKGTLDFIQFPAHRPPVSSDSGLIESKRILLSI